MAFIEKARAPDDLSQDIKQFYASETSMDSSRTDDLLEHMPYYIRVKIAKHLCRSILAAVRVFSGCGDYFLDALAVHLKETFYAPNQLIFAQDEMPKELYILQVRSRYARSQRLEQRRRPCDMFCAENGTRQDS